MARRRKAARFWPIVLAIVVLDVVTKALAVEYLVPMRTPREVIGDVVRLTLVYNPGAAFGLYLGEYSRWIFTVLTIAALVILRYLYRTTSAEDVPRLTAVALVTAGAIGNLIDRLRSAAGVVDFIDIGVGAWRWPTFNVADIAVSTGAFLLAWVLWGEDRAPAAEATAGGAVRPERPGAP